MIRRNFLRSSGLTVLGAASSQVAFPQTKKYENKNISAADFGVGPNNDPQKNTSGMLAMRSYMISNPFLHFEITLPPGEIRFLDAKWLTNVRSVTVNGGPTLLRNVRMNGPSTEKIGLWINEIFLDDIGSIPGFGKQVTGHSIETVAKGGSFVTLEEMNEGNRLQAGAYHLIHGYNQASRGYPPSLRYFEYVKVKSVRGRHVELESPLTMSYRADWADLEANDSILKYGKARILPLQRPGFRITEYCELNDIEFLPNPGAREGKVSSLHGSVYAGGCLNFKANRLKVNGYFYPTQGKNYIISDSIISFTEIDKVIDNILFDNCEIGNLENGPACNSVVVRGGRLLSPSAGINCRKLLFDGVQFEKGDGTRHQFVAAASALTMNSIEIKNPKFARPRGSDMPILRTGRPVKLRVIQVIHPNKIVIPFTGIGDVGIRSLDIGTILKSDSGVNIEVLQIYGSVDGTVVEGVWSNGIPAAGDLFSANMVRLVKISGEKEGNPVGGSAMIVSDRVGSGIYADVVKIEK